MKRALIFLLFAPASVATIWSIYGVANSVPRGVADVVAMCLFIFAFLVGAITAPADGLLARRLPVIARVPLVAMISAAIPFGMISWLDGCVISPDLLTPFSIGGAVCMGLCSLFSSEHSRWHFAIPGAE